MIYFCTLINNERAIKGLKIIVITASIIFCITFVIPYFMLNIPYFQRKVVDFSESELSVFFDTHVKIGEVNIKWPNHISLKDIQIKDRNDNQMLEADHIAVHYKLIPLLKNKWVLSTVRFFGVTCHIQKDSPHSDMNIQFMLDAVSGNSPGYSNKQFQLQSILVRRGTVTYDIMDQEMTGQQFNLNHINLSNLNCNLTVKHYSKDSIRAQINKMSFIESSGMDVKKFTGRLTGNPDSLKIENLLLSLPHSTLLMPSTALLFDRSDSLSQPADKSMLKIHLASSTITPQDFVFLTPHLKNFSDVINVSADISGVINSLSLNKLSLSFGRDLLFSGSMDLKNIANKTEELYLFGQVQRLYLTTEGLRRISNNFNLFALPVPEPVINIGELNFTGEISGFIDHLVAFGNLSSPVGSIQMDMMIGQQRNQDTSLYLKGNIASSDLQIHSLFREGNPYGKARFMAELDLVRPRDKKISGNINARINELEYRGYNYENIYVSGKYKENEYEGLVRVDDPNGQLTLQGLFKNENEKSVFNFNAHLSNFHPDKLHLTDKFEEPDISFGISADFTGNNPDDFNGFIELKDFAFITRKDSFFIHNLLIETFADELMHKQINIASSILNGNMKGAYSFSSLIPDLLTVGEKYLPTLVHSIAGYKPAETNNLFDFNFTVENTENISKTLELPFSILQKTGIQGHFNSTTNLLSATIDAPSFTIGAIHLEKGNLHIENNVDAINLQLSANQYGYKNIHNFLRLSANLKDDRIDTDIKWTSDTDERFEAVLTTSAVFVEEHDQNSVKKLRTEMTIPPAQIILNDSIWHVEPASVTISDRKVAIDNFYITKDDQHLHINGILSDNPQDELFLDLNDIEIGYIFDILNKPQLHFGGRTTGTVKARDLPGRMMIEGRLEIEDFSFLHVLQGKLNISSEWDNDRQGILLVGTIYKNDATWTDVNGYIFPIGAEQGLSLIFDANEINLSFLQYYMRSFADSICGTGFGEVLLAGSFNNLYLEGKPYVKDAHVNVNFLNTTYSFSDTVFLEKHRISVNNTTLYDKDGHSCKMDFTLNHSGFADMAFNMDIIADHLLVYDMPERINPVIYGKVYASGTSTVTGTEEFILVEGDVRSDAGTSVGFNFANTPSVGKYDFISFIDKSEIKRADEKNGYETEVINRSGTEYMLDFLVDVTTDAQIELILNPATGDKISVTGNGSIKTQYGSQSDIQMFGNYLVSGGTYNFNLEQVLRKRFNIRNGSIVSFRGDPLEANLNLDAIYNLTANVQDLDELLIRETASRSIAVNCVLKLDGHLQNPMITFDLELPNSNPEFERRVRTFINSEDMMTRQIIYLLLLHKFYTPDYSRNDIRTNEFSTVASSALSTQLSNMLNRLTDKVQIGANIRSRQDGIKDTEVEMLLSSQLLNNRLLFNGNFGYRDNYIQSNAFVGEFDLEYKLSRTGEISLKAYNHANDLYRYTNSLTRQGVGVMFRKDYNVLADLFRRRKKTAGNSNVANKTAVKTSAPASGSQ